MSMYFSDRLFLSVSKSVWTKSSKYAIFIKYTLIYVPHFFADSLKKIHISENREKIATKVDIPTCKLILW